MKILTKLVLDIASMEVLERVEVDYFGPVAECKGTDRAKQTQDQQMAMEKAAFAQQQGQIADLKKAFSPYTQGAGQGYDPATLAAMRSQFLNSNNQTFNQAGQDVRSALAARGSGTGDLPVGGDYTRGLSNLLGAQAGSQSQGLLGINVQNANQSLANRFNAGNLLSGNAATQVGTLGVTGAAGSNALNAYMNGANSGFTNAFTTGLGSALGKTLGGGNAGGFGGIFAKGCWVAAAVYDGWEDQRTLDVRHWLFTEWNQTFVGNAVCRLYLRFGERVAQEIPKHPWLKHSCKWLMDKALAKARS